MLFRGFGFDLVYIIGALLICLTWHEASHALVADRLGDDTPRRMGRLSLNPLAHLDPLGSLMILFVGFGWGKPVQVDAQKLRYGPKIGMALVAIAGPISNFLLAFIIAIPLRLHLLSFTSQKVFSLGGQSVYLSTGCGLQTIISLSLALAIFNLIPISPLDGSRIWQILLPEKWYWPYARYEILGVFVVMGLVLADLYLGTGILDRILTPPLNFFWNRMVGFGAPFDCISGGG